MIPIQTNTALKFTIHRRFWNVYLHSETTKNCNVVFHGFLSSSLAVSHSSIVEFASLLRLITYSWAVYAWHQSENHIEPNDIGSQTQCHHCYCQQQNYNHDQVFSFSFSHSFIPFFRSFCSEIQRSRFTASLLGRCRVCKILAVKVKVNKLYWTNENAGSSLLLAMVRVCLHCILKYTCQSGVQTEVKWRENIRKRGKIGRQKESEREKESSMRKSGSNPKPKYTN